MKFLVFISTESGVQRWKGQADSLTEAQEKALTSIDTNSKTITDTSVHCQWHWQNDSCLGSTEHCNTCGFPVYREDEEYYCSECAQRLRQSEASGQLYLHRKTQ